MRWQITFETNRQRVVSPDIFDSKELVDDKVVTATKSVGMVEERFLQKKYTWIQKENTNRKKKELNKVSKAVMCEVMLDIQMIVPTGRPMGDGGGSESSLFQNLYIQVGKDKHLIFAQWLG